MHLTLAAVTILLLLAPLAQAGDGISVQFAAPALATGDLRDDLAGLVVLVPGPGGLDATWETPFDGTWMDHNRTFLQTQDNVVLGYGVYPTGSQDDGPWPAHMPAATHLHVGKERSYILLESDQISIRTNASAARWTPSPPQGIFAFDTPSDMTVPLFTNDVALPAGETVLATPYSYVHVIARHVHGVGWSNADLSCSAHGCPSGGQWGSQRVGVPGSGTNATLWAVPHVHASGGDADLVVHGWARLAIVSAPRHDVDLLGAVFLPHSQATPTCTSCTFDGNKTLSLQGHITLARLSHDDKGRLSADLGGDIQAARLDEKALDPAALGGAVGATIGASLVVLGVKFLATALFTRLKSDPLEHPRRRRIFEYIQSHPGATFREVARGAEIATGTTRHHLTILKRHGTIMEKPHGSTTRFFENHGKFDVDWADVVLLREPPLKQLHDWLALNPEVPQKDVLEAMAVHGWSRSTTQHRLQRLVEGGVADLRLQGRLKIYKVAGPRPAVPRLVAFARPALSRPV